MMAESDKTHSMLNIMHMSVFLLLSVQDDNHGSLWLVGGMTRRGGPHRAFGFCFFVPVFVVREGRIASLFLFPGST